MQAGTAGMNIIRMYNPIKQSKDHGSNGTFIKQWVPELKDIPTQFIHEPWRMTIMNQSFYNIELGKDYPYSIVNEAAKRAREKF